jgi:cysteine synthase A
MNARKTILGAIGNTPLIRLNRVTEGVGAHVLAKCEFVNPSGSIKDRIALRMIEEAEKSGKIKKGAVVVEGSTGNTAVALSFVCAVKGYKAVMCMPKGWATEDRTKIIRSYGAEVVEVDPGEEVEKELKGKSVHGGVVELLPRIKCLEMETNNPNTWWARQALNKENIAAHRETTGKEIIEQTNGNVDAFVCAVGTGGTLLGVSEALLAMNPDIKIYAVEPASSSLLKMAPQLRPYMKKFGIPGISGWIISEIENRGIITETHLVEDKDAISMTHRLTEEEGLFCGMSSGANVFIALKVAKQLGKGKRVVTILPDSRDRYFFEEHFTT